MANMITPIEFNQYDKISDDICFLDRYNIVRFNVSLSRTNNENGRKTFHSEYKYPSRKDGNYRALISLRRSYDYYLSIESVMKDKDGNKEFIMIGPNEFIMFRNALREVLRWFTDKEYDHLFALKKEKLIMVTPIPCEELKYLPMGKYITFRPCLVMRGETETEPGVEIELNSSTNVSRMNVNRFMGIYYLLENFNMVLSAQLMINYLGRPEYGTNLVDFGSSGYSNITKFNSHEEMTVMNKRRQIKDNHLTVEDL